MLLPMLSEHHARMVKNNPMVLPVSEAILEGCDLALLRGERLLFEGLSFSLNAGDALLLRGLNGSGKTSLLRLIAGLIPPTSGVVLWHGVSILDDEFFHEDLHYVGHRDAVKPLLTVAENVYFWSNLRGGSGTLAALNHFGLNEIADLPARFLSAGQRKRVGLARLLSASGNLWLLDEPAVGLDEESVATLLAAIREHRAGGGVVQFDPVTGILVVLVTQHLVDHYGSRRREQVRILLAG